MRSLRFGLVCGATLATFVLAGCPKDRTAEPDAGLAEAPQALDAGTQPLVRFAVQYQAPDAGLAELPLAPDEQPVIEPTSTLEFRSTPGLRNYRVRLFDETERAMISDDVTDEAPDGLVYRIQLPTPLKSGHKYTLVVDAQTGSAMTDTQGREVEELRAEFRIAGEKEKPPPPPQNGKKRRR